MLVPRRTAGRTAAFCHEGVRRRPEGVCGLASSGQRFGPYRCVRKLGNGGMAETWLAVQRGEAGFEQRVCLKLVHEPLRNADDFGELFMREAAIAASLR